MHDKRYPEEKITLWCCRRRAGEELKSQAMVPCSRTSCNEYRQDYPYCLFMTRVGKRGRL